MPPRIQHVSVFGAVFMALFAVGIATSFGVPFAQSQSSVAVCGDGIVQFGEQCDAGPLNGQEGGFCSQSCTNVFGVCFEEGCGCYAKAATDAFGHPNAEKTKADLTANAPNNGQATPNDYGLNRPHDVLIHEKNQALYIADTFNNRIVVHNLTPSLNRTDYKADDVIGQPNLLTNVQGYDMDFSMEELSEESYLNQPTALAADTENNRFYIADTNNNRVVVLEGFSRSGFNAVKVLGQPDLSSHDAPTDPGTGNMLKPRGVAVSKRGYVYVSDEFNRVLRFDVRNGIQTGMDATLVLGQEGFTNKGPGTVNTKLFAPVGLTYDDLHEKLYVVDRGNHRIMVFDEQKMTQNGIAASDEFGLGYAGTSSEAYRFPEYALISGTDLFVSDTFNNRLLRSDIDLPPGAQDVYGQDDFYTGGPPTDPLDPPTASSFAEPRGMDRAACRLFIADTENNRVMLMGNEDGCDPPEPPVVAPKDYGVIATAATLPNTLFLQFNTMLNPVAASNPQNYVVQGAVIPIDTVTMLSDRSILLTTAEELDPETSYSLNITYMIANDEENTLFASPSEPIQIPFTTPALCVDLPEGECCDPLTCDCGCGEGLTCNASTDVCEAVQVSSSSTSSSSSEVGTGEQGGQGGDGGTLTCRAAPSNACSVYDDCTGLYKCAASGDGCSCQSSCPFVYAWNGEEYVLQNEAIPFSFMRVLEGTTYGSLPDLQVHDGELRMRVTEERDEVSYIDALTVTAVDHDDADASAMFTVDGDIHLVRKPNPSDSCVTSEGEDCTVAMQANDEHVFTIDPQDVYDRSPDDLTHDVIMEFAKPSNATIAKLIINAEVDDITDITAYELLKHIGARQESMLNLLLELFGKEEFVDNGLREGGLYLGIDVWNGKNWERQGDIRPGNYRQFDDFLVALDVSDIPANTLRIRLSTIGWYIYNFAGIDWSENSLFTAKNVPLQTATINAEDAVSLLASDDQEYVVLEKGNAIDITLPDTVSSSAHRDYLFALDGYYEPHVPGDARPSVGGLLRFIGHLWDHDNGLHDGFLRVFKELEIIK